MSKKTAAVAAAVAATAPTGAVDWGDEPAIVTEGKTRREIDEQREGREMAHKHGYAWDGRPVLAIAQEIYAVNTKGAKSSMRKVTEPDPSVNA